MARRKGLCAFVEEGACVNQDSQFHGEECPRNRCSLFEKEEVVVEDKSVWELQNSVVVGQK